VRQALRVLLIEDNDLDAQLLVRELRRGGYEVAYERVETEAALEAALRQQGWDLVVSDFSMPELDAPRALAIFKEQQLDVPFVIVSGTVDEVTAVASMRAGAHDFIAKGKLARLLPVVERELREVEGRAERRHMQEQLLVSDRMASLGTLAAGVAHEINNPLAAVLANLDVVLLELDDALTTYEVAAEDSGMTGKSELIQRMGERLASSMPALRDAREAALRVSDVSRDLKVFSRGSESRRSAVDVHLVLESSLRMARTEIRHRAQVVRQFEEVPAVTANETRLGQVFLNLIVNAAQSIPEGAASRHEIRVVTTRAGADRVVVEVHDTGGGIPADALPRIFDPFFTTKPIGVGTGLGLAICHRLVTELGGEIVVDSRPGSGTMVRVTLPVATESPAPVEDPPVVASAATRRAKILVIDDDELVLNAARRILAPHHDVSAIARAQEALDRVEKGEWFDVVLCDVLMPEMTGMALHEALVRRAPEQAGRVVFMTGGAFTPAAREFLEQVRQPLLDKPFEAAALLALVEKLLR
jgi:signal transduction histidine kinase